MARSFGKLIMTLVTSVRRFQSSKRLKMMNTSVSSPRNSVAAMQLLALAGANTALTKEKVEKSKLVVKIKIPEAMKSKKNETS